MASSLAQSDSSSASFVLISSRMVPISEISGSMVRDKIDCVKRSDADVLVCNDGGCTLNITGAMHRHGIRTPTKHIAEIIAEGLGLMPSIDMEASHA